MFVVCENAKFFQKRGEFATKSNISIFIENVFNNIFVCLRISDVCQFLL